MFTSIFIVEDMMGTMRSNSRHIRVEFYQKDDYNKIVNDGKIGLQRQIFEVEEYLPPPKILICSKCNIPGHQKKNVNRIQKYVEDVVKTEMMVINMIHVLLNVNIAAANIWQPIINAPKLSDFVKN